MHVGSAYKREKLEESWDSIVIGSGMGGLTTAAMLSRHAGQRVLVLERHYEPGGFTHVFRRPGYEWDVGVHYVGGMRSPRSSVRRMFEHLTRGRLKWSPLPDAFDRIEIAGRAYELVTGFERHRERLVEYFPSERRAIDRYLATVFAANRWIGLYMAEKAIPAPLARVFGGLMRWPYLRWANRTTADVLRSITANPELTAVLTGQWGDYGLPPGESSFAAHAAVASHYFGGAWYPVGGSSQIAASIAPEITANGGRIVVGAEVSSLLMEGDRAVGVRMADGRALRARTVISNAGARTTFGRLVPASVGAPMLERLREVPPSTAHLCLYVGCRGVEPLPAANRWIYNGPDHDGEMQRFARDPSGAFPVLFFSFPSERDPSFATRHPGRSTIEIVAPIPYSSFERWADTRWKKRGHDYDDFKASLQQRLVQALEAYVPQVRGHVEVAELSTPLSTAHFANHAQGEVYGLAHSPARYRLRSLGARTPVRGFFLTGSDICMCGVAGAMMGGVVAASAVLGRNLVSAAMRPQG